MTSIRKHLLLWQLTALVLVGLTASLATYWLAWNSFQKSRDYELEQIAYSVLRHGVENVDPDENEDQGQFVSQIWDAGGALVYSSIEPVMPRQHELGFNEFDWQGERWRTYTLQVQGLVIQVGHTAQAKTERLLAIVGPLLVPLGLLMPLMGLAIWLAVGRSLVPMARIRQELEKRDPKTLSPISSDDLPSELVPMVSALNGLLARLDEAIESQRRFVADAAHELRTPLTAVRLQAQIAERSSDPGERAEALTKLEAGIHRAAHLVDQLLALARLEPNVDQTTRHAINLDDIVRQAIGEHSQSAEAKKIDLGLIASCPVYIESDPASVRMLIGNLIDNAIRYTPATGRIDVSLEQDERGVRLIVADNGPGIPVEERNKVFERFYRLADASIPGSGLGLSIVARAAEQQGAVVNLEDNPGGGLRAVVFFPTLNA